MSRVATEMRLALTTMQMVDSSVDATVGSIARRQEALQLAVDATGGLAALRRLLAGLSLDAIDRDQLGRLADAVISTSSMLTGSQESRPSHSRLAAASFVVDAAYTAAPLVTAVETLSSLGQEFTAVAQGTTDVVPPELLAFAEQLVASARRRASSPGETIIRS